MAKLFHCSRLTQLMINDNLPYLCLAHRLAPTLSLTKMILNRNMTFDPKFGVGCIHVRHYFGLTIYVMSIRPQIKMLSCMGRGALALTFCISQNTLLAKKVVTPPLKTIKPMWIELLCFHLAEIGMIWTRDCSPTKSDTTLGRHSMQGQVGSSSSETTV